ncbi:MAG: nodulation protein NfeD [Pseudomonadota bacterium]
MPHTTKNIGSKKLVLNSILVLLCLFFLTGSAETPTPTSTQAIAVQLSVDGAIGPAIQDYISRGLKFAQRQKASVIILQINTPGGLDKSMRKIITDILASPIPVVSYVAPSGAHAASAGTFILYATPIAAMAPGTNLGAASPVSIGGSPSTKPTPEKDTKEKDSEKNKQSDKNQEDNKIDSQTTLEKKASNDASAYIRSLAQLHGRNAEWAEQAVRAAASLSAQEALQANVINIIADNPTDLLNKIDGRSVKLSQGTITLHTKNARIVYYHPDWRTKFLAVITDPSIAYLLLMAGIWGLFLEFAYAGTMIPGVLGVICLLIGLYGLQLLPINYVGFGLMILGIGFFIAEIFIPTFGILGIGGIISLTIGSIMLINTDVAHFGISIPLILSVSITTGIFLLLIIYLVIKSHRGAIVSGREKMIGSHGVIEKDYKGQLFARVNGEQWQINNPEQFTPGQTIKVVAIEDLVLTVMLDKQGEKNGTR